MKLDDATLRDLVDEKLPRGAVRAIQSAYKDPGRFDQYVALLQSRVPYDEAIVLPFGEHLNIVHMGGGAYIVRCDCGHGLGDYRENWKLSSLMRVRRTEEELREIYPAQMAGDPRWNELREFFCPGCKTLLEVDVAPPGYPISHDFLPDLEGFYRDWLGRTLPQ
jgi:acetone carboxylase, gamma subunit